MHNLFHFICFFYFVYLHIGKTLESGNKSDTKFLKLKIKNPKNV